MINIFEQELLPNIKKYDVVLFGMSIYNAFNRGLLYDIALNFPDVKKIENEKSSYGDKKKYGTILSIQNDGIIFCACYMNDGGYNRWRGNPVYAKYDKLEECLNLAKKKFKGKKICSPIIGASYYDGDGNKEVSIEIYKKVFTDCDIDLYDYDQKEFRNLIFKRMAILKKDYKEKKITREEYNDIKNHIMWEKENGIFIPMPPDYTYAKKSKDYIRVKKEDLEK